MIEREDASEQPRVGIAKLDGTTPEPEVRAESGQKLAPEVSVEFPKADSPPSEETDSADRNDARMVSVRAPSEDCPPPGPSEEPSVHVPEDLSPPAVPPATATDESMRQLQTVLRERLLPGESEADFEAFRAAIFAALQPRDAIEVIWAADVVQYAWGAFRMGRQNAAYLSLCAFQALATSYYSFRNPDQVRQIWTRDLATDRRQIDELMAAVGVSREMLYGAGLRQNVDAFERMARIKASDSIRRDAILREIDRRRTFLAANASQTGGQTDSQPQPPALEGRQSHGERT
jgi:hypothetical protein